jgi:phosphopantothenoylcysteine decarboxylase/phosphopantothenate--cysteine ligase
VSALAGKTVVLGVTGSIAAYKAADLTRALRKEGAAVHAILTDGGSRFITPLTLQALTQNPVHTELFNLISEERIGHISLAERADLLLIAPATANILGKAAGGIADDMLSTVFMATKAPVLFAPAMNSGMYSSAAVQANLELLASRGYLFVGPGEGLLACGTSGPGRMSDPPEILEAARMALSPKELAGRKVVVTAGPTREPMDPVRYLSNRSSGKMGYALAAAARRFGADVVLVSGPVALPDPPFLRTVRVETAEEMAAAVEGEWEDADCLVMCAAVADFRPAAAAERKIKKEGFAGRLDLVPAVDILASLGSRKGKRVLVGFAAETDGLEGNAVGKLARKGLDAVAANDVSRGDIGFGADENELTVFFAGGERLRIPKRAKEEAAEDLFRALLGKGLLR